MNEEWKDVTGYEGIYQVSNKGKVKSLFRYVEQSPGVKRSIKERVLKNKVNTSGHNHVVLRRDGIGKSVLVHVLVAEHFIGPKPDGLIVLHGPNGQKDNSVTNLRYGTHLQNVLDRRRDGTDFNLNKTHCIRNHLLKEPNLVISSLPKRNCRSCKNARSKVKDMRVRRGLLVSENELKLLADEYYLKFIPQ